MDERSFVAAQDFLLEAKKYWTTEIYGALKADYRHKAAKAAHGEPADVRAMLGETVLYRYYAWLERHLQRFKYSGRYGLVPYHRERREALLAGLADPGERLELDPDLDVPKYYSAVDIHQHPGGVSGEDIAGFVYERGSRSTTPTLGARHRDLHQRFTDILAAEGTPSRILDMGCGFGKSTRPFYDSFPEAQVEAIDLSAPCLALAASIAAEDQARNVRYRQMDALATDYDDAAFDLVTSTMLIHEMPQEEIERSFAEAHRMLAPGGRMAHLDFLPASEPFARFIHYGHGRRNNEPFMRPFAEMDLEGVLAGLGFRDIEIHPFAEADGVDTVDSAAWRFPWAVVSARKA